MHLVFNPRIITVSTADVLTINEQLEKQNSKEHV
jgi:hypothetical protein